MSSNQHAYTKGESVETALHSLEVTVESPTQNMRLEY